MSYGTPAQFRKYIKQLPTTVVDQDIQDVQDRAYSIVTQALDGITFSPGLEVSSPKIVHGYGGEILALPVHQAGSISQVKDQWGYIIPSSLYTENEDGTLWSGNSAGVTFYWSVCRYTVAAVWGAVVPASVVELELELAVNIWREKDKGAFSDAIGVEGGGELKVGYQRALTNRQQMIVDQLKRQYGPPIVV